MADIAPELLKIIQQRYRERINESDILNEIGKCVADGNITYENANEAAQEVGKILSETYRECLSAEMLPDGKMYYNIADRVIGNTMTEAHDYISDITERAQNIANEHVGIGLKAVRPEMNQDRIDGIVNRVSNADNYDDIAWILDAPVRTFCQSIVDDFVKANAEFQGKSGLKPKIIRKTSGKCCEWCSRLAGAYMYPDVPKDVYRRHNNCNCTVEYDPGSGKKYQDVWSKTWRYQKDKDRINELKAFSGITKTTMISENVEDVSLEYFKKSTPGTGKIIQHQGFDSIRRKDDLNTANWIIKELGGDVTLLEEANRPGELTPDFKWNGEYWEAKTITSRNSIDKQLRKGSKQLGEEKGGIIIDATGRTIEIDDVINEVAYRLPKRARGDIDVIIKEGNTFIKALRYKR